ncbi:MAG: GTPase domain-containing protein [Candidatus Lokiarchaeota archaeon]|nr:GTPase domain-containing protein [Candidatus Lokiarchaeota archaeon]
MTKKIVFVGPPSSGKSTLRRLFFEGESAFDLLNHPLEPTRGSEIYTYKMKEEIGVFDLSGQELNRWLGQEQEVFQQTDVILITLDATTDFNLCSKLITQMQKIQQERCSSATCYILFHKIDLLSDKDHKILKDNIKQNLPKSHQCSIYYTSIRNEFYLNTLNVVLDILDDVQSKQIISTPYNFNTFRSLAGLLSQLKKMKVANFAELTASLNVHQHDLATLLNQLSGQKYLLSRNYGSDQVFFLSDAGEEYYKEFVQRFLHKRDIEETRNLPNFAFPSVDDVKFERFDFNLSKINNKKYVASMCEKLIYGILISDENGRLLITVENGNNALKNILATEDNPSFDIELVPMFINAMYKFSAEINLQGFTGFQLQGKNINVHSMQFDRFTLTCFTSPYFNPEIVKDAFIEMFDRFSIRYDAELEDFLQTGNATPFQSYKPAFLKEFQKITVEFLHQLDSHIDEKSMNSYKELYRKLDGIQLSMVSDSLRYKLKDFKLRFIQAILDQDYTTLNDLSKKVDALSLKIVTN